MHFNAYKNARIQKVLTIVFKMTTPLLLQALEINTFIWLNFPFVRLPWQWNPQKHRFEAEKSPKRIFAWFICSTVLFGFLFTLYIFLVVVGLKVPHNDKLQNWILTFELFPCVTYIFFYNWKIYSIGIPNFIAYFNSLTQMLKVKTDLRNVSVTTTTESNLVRFATTLLKGTQGSRSMQFM